MRNRSQFLTLSLAVLAFTSSAIAGKPSSCLGNPNVTAIVHDYDTSGTLLLLRSDDSTYPGGTPVAGQGTYNHLDPSVGSVLWCGWWHGLTLYQQSTVPSPRTWFITPNVADGVPGKNPLPVPIPPAGQYWQHVDGGVKCYDQNLNLVFFQSITTSSTNCEFATNFLYNGVQYFFAMGPSSLLPGGPPTGLVTVTCNGLDTSISPNECNHWTITPSPGTNATIANLYTAGKQSTFLGQFQNTFRIEITNP